MKKNKLVAQKRDLLGRKVKKLRREGLIPATIYGKKTKSLSLTVNKKDLEKVYGDVGETGLVELTIGDESRPVLIHNIQQDPVDSRILHVEFFQVDLKEKVHAKVPLEFVGESPTVAQKQGILLTILDEIEVEALPTDLPEKITVDVVQLTQVNQELKVRDLSVPSAVTVLTDTGLTAVKIGPLVTKEAEAEAVAAAAEAAAEAEAAAAEEAPEAEEAPSPEAEKKEEKQVEEKKE